MRILLAVILLPIALPFILYKGVFGNAEDLAVYKAILEQEEKA